MCFSFQDTDHGMKEQLYLQEMKLPQDINLGGQFPCLVTGPSLEILSLTKRLLAAGRPASFIV